MADKKTTKLFILAFSIDHYRITIMRFKTEKELDKFCAFLKKEYGDLVVWEAMVDDL